MFDWLKKAFGDSKPEHRRRREPEPEREFSPAKLPPRRGEPVGLRSVPGALVASDNSGRVIYNMLTPHMQQFMGRCVGAVKRAGISAKGTGQFSITVGEQRLELHLDQFYQPSDDPALVEHVVVEVLPKNPTSG